MEMTQFLVADDASEESLRQFQEPQFLLPLSFELANDDKPVESRRLAGILLKKSLVTHWIELDTVIKSQIKDLLLTTLASPAPEASDTAAQVIGKVASLEVPLKQWPQLFKSLHSYVIQEDSPVHLKMATMETLGYVWEEITSEDLERHEAYTSLRALLYGTSASQTGAEVHLAGLNALLKALHPPQAVNLDNAREEMLIIKILQISVLSKEVNIRQAAFKCLVSIVSRHYKVLARSLACFYQPTLDAISGDGETLALQAIEYCISVCEIEIKTHLPYWFHPNPSDFPYWALHFLVPILLETLLKPPGDVSRASATCLGLIVRLVGDVIVPDVTSFVEAKISDPHWKRSVLDVPAFVKLAVLEFLLKDENKHVGDTALTRSFEFLYGPATGSPVRLVAVLLKAIDVPDVAEKICGDIYKLAQGYEDAGALLITPYPGEIIQHLLAAAELKDGEASKIRAAAAYDILNVVVRCSNFDQASNIVAHLLSEIIQEIDLTMHVPIELTDDREKHAKLLGSICVVLQSLIHKLSGTDNK